MSATPPPSPDDVKKIADATEAMVAFVREEREARAAARADDRAFALELAKRKALADLAAAYNGREDVDEICVERFRSIVDAIYKDVTP